MATTTIPPLEHAVHRAVETSGDGGIPEIPNIVSLLTDCWHAHPWAAWLHHWETLVFSLIVALGLCGVAWRYARRPSTIPGTGQNLLELFVEGVDQFVHNVIGTTWRQHTPFIGTLFVYIWCMNLSVLVPGMKSSTSSLNTTVGLALVVFCYVQWIRIKTLGPWKYLHHMAGSPRFDDVRTAPLPLKVLMLPIKVFVMVVLFLLELVGEFVKPISLSLRLGFNVFAEDVLLAVLLGLGLAAGSAIHSPVGLPFQLFVVPLILIFSTVQALVFSLLSSVYIVLMSPDGTHH